ncbi:MAG: hypothetical protein KIT44_05175 [Opitutaceae bacterium]|nr:hypothetical protein [Opitutaceae bacterium]
MLVVSLLGLLVLAAYALSVLARVNSSLATVKSAQTQARQNALLGLHVALGELQRHAGADERITGMAGIAGVPAGGVQTARHWAGVWSPDGTHLAWLASGGEAGVVPAVAAADSLPIVATNSLGASVTDREHVRIVRQTVPNPPGGLPGSAGHYAYWAGDEGVKLSLALADGATLVPGGKHAIETHFPGVSPTAPAVLDLRLYEQVALAGATTAQRQGGFHSHTLRHESAADAGLISGRLNVNSTSVRYWRGVADTYNALRPAGSPVVNADAFAQEMAVRAPAADPIYGKPAGGPFLTVESFLQGQALIAALAAGGGSLLDFITVMEPWLTVRSDTFRIRAYGDAVNAVDPARVEAVAYAEAIVQRMPEGLPGFGRRFVIRHFRWLGPDDI